MNNPELPPRLPEAGGPPSAQQVKEYAAFMRLLIASPVSGQEEVDEQSRQDMLLYSAIYHNFADNSGYSEKVEEGKYPTLRNYAATVAHELVEGYAGEWTLPRAFGVHALAAINAVAFRPSEDVEHGQDRMAFFLMHLARKLALALPEHVVINEVSFALFAHAVGNHGITKAAAKKVGERHEWLKAKIDSLGASMVLRRHLTRTIDSEPKMEVDDAKELRQNNAILFNELRRLQRYSIKSAVHEGSSTSWSIHDLYDTKLQIASHVENAQSEIHPERWSSMVMYAIEQPHEDGRLIQLEVDPDADIREMDSLYYFGRPVFMDENGELFADAEGAVSYREFYKKAGKPVNYEALRQFLIQKYFDLTVPIEIVRETAENAKKLLASRRPDIEREQGIVYHDLLLPRIKVLQRYRRSEELDEIEKRETQPYPYPRVGHVARLPEGYRAHPDALALAAEHNIEVPEGYTYRKPYLPDPTVAKSVAHRAKQRKGQPPKPDTTK